MKKHLYKLTALAAVTTLIAMQSCNKDNDSKSREEMLIGTWNAYQAGIDSNKNGVWDIDERNAVQASSGLQFTFEKGGTGRAKGDTTLSGVPMAWTLSNNDTDLRMILSHTNGNIDTLMANLISFEASEMIMKVKQGDRESYGAFRK